MSDRRAIGWLALTSFLVQIPFLRRGISPLDEGSILAIAHDLARGERLYANLITPIGPLTYETVGLLVKWLGPQLLIVRFFMALVFSGCVVLVFDLLRQSVPPGWARAGAIAVMALKPLGFPLWTIVNYSQLGMLFSLLALSALFRFLPERRLAWLAVAGLAVGATLVTKQNLGLLIGGVCVLGIAGDWLRDRAGGPAHLACSCAALLGGLLLPVIGFLGLYAAQGGLGSLIQHAVLDLGNLADAYWIPLAPLHLWWWGIEDLGRLAFSYYPAPVAQLVLQGQLSLESTLLVSIAGAFVDAAYYLPLLSLLPAGLWLVRGARGAEPRVSWSRSLVITSFAGASYASMLYRADWAHLMNVYPAQLLLLTAVTARAVVRCPGLWRPALALEILWLGAAVAVAFAALISTGSAVDTALGRIWAAPDQAENTKRVLSHLASRPEEEVIALLPDFPIYYPLSARRNPLSYDLLVPGLVGPEDDRRAATQLAAVDRVIYNSKPRPSVWSLLPEYAPRTAAALAHDFEIEEILSDSAYVFARREKEPHSSRPVADLWKRFDPERIEVEMRADDGDTGNRRPTIEQTSWMMYRVISTPLDASIASACFSIPHRVGKGEWLAVTPVFDPRTWPPNYSKIWYPETSSGLFEVSVQPEAEAAFTLWSQRLSPGAPEASRSLESLAGQTVALRFCTRPAGRTQAGEIRVPAGWAEPRVLAPASF